MKHRGSRISASMVSMSFAACVTLVPFAAQAVARVACVQSSVPAILTPEALLPERPAPDALKDALRIAGVSRQVVSDEEILRAVARADQEFNQWEPGAKEVLRAMLGADGVLRSRDVPKVMAQRDAGRAIVRKALDDLLAAAKVEGASASLARQLLDTRKLRSSAYPMSMELTIGATTAVVQGKISLLEAAELSRSFKPEEAGRAREALTQYSEAMARTAREVETGVLVAMALMPAAERAAREWVAAGTPEEREERAQAESMFATLLAGAPLLVALSRGVDAQVAGVEALSEAVSPESAWSAAAAIVYGPQAEPPEGYAYIGPDVPAAGVGQQQALSRVRTAYIAADFPQLLELMTSVQEARGRIAVLVGPFSSGAVPTAETVGKLASAVAAMGQQPPRLKDWRMLFEKRQETARKFAALAKDAARATPESAPSGKP
jgi:hypothetical protein